LERWLNVMALGEIRSHIDYAIVNGVLAGPVGILNEQSTVTVAKDSGQTNGTITATNITGLWSAMYAGSKENAVWLANDDVIQAIDNLATSGQWPALNWVPAGQFGNRFATIKGRPLIPCEACPAIGNPGDLICWDPTDTIFTYLKAPSNIGNI